MINVKRKILKTVCLFIALITLFSSFSFNVVHADELEYPFDYTNVMDDLESSKDFDIMNYPWDPAGKSESSTIMNVVEWCYSPFKPNDFALYVYFYNPNNFKIDTNSPSARVQMATAYKNEADGTPATIVTADTVPCNYDTFKLAFCSKSTRAGYEGLFYKYRVIDQVGKDGLTVQERVYSGERRYDISGITLVLQDGTYKEFTVGGTYFFTGYAKGYGADENAESTLKNTKFLPLETIRLEVHHTNYRTESSSVGVGHQNDLNSVYFSVPNKYFNDYGKLQKIKAEWYEYDTQPIYIFGSETNANIFKQFIGKKIDKNTAATDYWFGILSSVEAGAGDVIGPYHFDNVFNPPANDNTNKFDSYISSLYYVFDANLTKELLITGEKLEDYIKNYTASAERGYLPVGSGKVSADLFKEGLNTTRASVPYVDDDVHHKLIEFDTNDKFDILNEQERHGAFTTWLITIGGGSLEQSIKDVPAIEYEGVGKKLAQYTNADLPTKLLMDTKYIADFRTYYETETANDCTPIIFRYALTDYTVFGGQVYNRNDKFGALYNSKGAYREISQTVFMDFDIIQLTFQDDNAKYTVIPVVNTPIDVYNDLNHKPIIYNSEYVGAVLFLVIFFSAVLVGFSIWISKKIYEGAGEKTFKTVVFVVYYTVIAIALYLIISTGIIAIGMFGGL